MEIGKRVKRLREELGITQEELATRLGYKSKSSVAHIEKGRDIPRSMVVKLADILGTTPAYLMGWNDEKNAPTAVGESDLFNYLKQTYSTDELKELASLSS